MTEKVKRDPAGTITLVLVLVGITLVGLVVILLLSNTAKTDTPGAVVAGTTSDFNGVTLIDPSQNIPDFTLTNKEGGTTKLSDLRGKPTLLFFGFTHCPDICPTTLSEYRRIHETLSEDKVNFVFISIDGERDTPPVLKQRFETSNVPFVIGLTETRETVLKAGAPFNVIAEPGEKDASGNYTIAHTASIFVLNAQGQWVAKYAYGMAVETIISDLQGRL